MEEWEKNWCTGSPSRGRASRDVQQVWAIKDNNREVLTNKEEIVSRWREYFVTLMNEENPKERRECGRRNTTMEEEVSREEVKRALMKMKRGKAVGPDGIPAEVWTMLGEMGLNFLVRLFNYLLNEKEMPKEWRRSVLVPVYKNKGMPRAATTTGVSS